MLLFTIAFMFVIAPIKAMPLDKDVGTMIFMPENQINVDVVSTTIQATTLDCDRWLEYKNYESTDLTIMCDPELMINSILCGYFVQNVTIQIIYGNQINDRQIASKVLANHQRGVNTRLDIGERIDYIYFNKRI